MPSAKQIQNRQQIPKGKRIFPQASRTLNISDIAKAEWKRLVENFWITDADVGLLTQTVCAYSVYHELYDTLTQQTIIEDGKKKKIKLSIADYCKGRNSQNQVVFTQLNKANSDYLKGLKMLNDYCKVPTTTDSSFDTSSPDEEELLAQLLD